MAKTQTKRAGLIAAQQAMQKECDGVKMFRSLDTQDRIFTSTASELLVRGGNRAGKTVCVAERFAAIARDIPIHLSNGERHDCRQPWQKDRPLIMWVVGKDWNHVGATIYRVLFRAGLYKMLRDPITGRWRAFNPIQDAHLSHLTKPSPPLIPMSEVKGGLDGIAWEEKKSRRFKFLELTNGTMIYAYSSTGPVKEGDAVDEIWIDERLDNPSHYGEYMMRRPDVKGRLTWSSLSRADPKLIEVSRRAEEQKRELESKEREKIDCEEIKLLYLHNPFIDDEEKAKSIASLSEEERTWRVDGEFFVGNLLIYPRFSRIIHSAIARNQQDDDPVSSILRGNNGQPPADWTRELIIDPGTVKPGVLFCAITAPKGMVDGVEEDLWKGNEPSLVVYDEIYFPRQDAQELTQKILGKARGHRFERFIIDGQAARQTPMGFAGTVGGNYSAEFSRMGLLCNQTGSGFTYGDPNFVTAQQLVDKMLAVRTCGTARLRIVIDKCPHLVNQMEGNLRATERGVDGTDIPLDKPALRQKDDLRRALEYWISRHPKYVEPLPPVLQKSPGQRFWESLQSRSKAKTKSTINIGPGKVA